VLPDRVHRLVDLRRDPDHRVRARHGSGQRHRHRRRKGHGAWGLVGAQLLRRGSGRPPESPPAGCAAICRASRSRRVARAARCRRVTRAAGSAPPVGVPTPRPAPPPLTAAGPPTPTVSSPTGPPPAVVSLPAAASPSAAPAAAVASPELRAAAGSPVRRLRRCPPPNAAATPLPGASPPAADAPATGRGRLPRPSRRRRQLRPAPCLHCPPLRCPAVHRPGFPLSRRHSRGVEASRRRSATRRGLPAVRRPVHHRRGSADIGHAAWVVRDLRVAATAAEPHVPNQHHRRHGCRRHPSRRQYTAAGSGPTGSHMLHSVLH